MPEQPIPNFVDRYDGLIFDCDGTLSHSMPLHYVAWRETMDRYGIDFPESRFYEMAGMPSEQIIEILSREQAVQVDSQRASDEKERAFEIHLDRLEPIEATCTIARGHHGKLPMAVASGGIRRVVDAQLRQLEVRHLFEIVVTAEDTTAHKPEPDVFLAAADGLGVPPSRCLVFEDSPLGFTAAERAGMQWVDVRPWVSAA